MHIWDFKTSLRVSTACCTVFYKKHGATCFRQMQVLRGNNFSTMHLMSQNGVFHLKQILAPQKLFQTGSSGHHIQTCTYIHTYTNTYKHVYTYMYTCLCIHVHMLMHTYMVVYIETRGYFMTRQTP